MRSMRFVSGAIVFSAITMTTQAQVVRLAPRASVGAVTIARDDDERPAIGVNTNSGGKRDTLGLLISSVTEGGPAEKAGIEEGSRIVSVNGVSLKLSAADAGEPDMGGVMSNRLVRELRKVKAGDEVTLVIYADGRNKTVKVKTTEMADLNRTASRGIRRTVDEMQERAVLGLNLGGMGSRRDTLGVLIVGVERDGPAEKAGVEEGNRISSINGVDLRVRAEDAGDDEMSGVKSGRFSREMQKVKAGDEVELKVYAEGRSKAVRVKSATAKDVYPRGRGMEIFFNGGSGRSFLMPGMPPTPPMPPRAPMIRGRAELESMLNSPDAELERGMLEAQRGMEEATRVIRQRSRSGRADFEAETTPSDAVSAATRAQYDAEVAAVSAARAFARTPRAAMAPRAFDMGSMLDGRIHVDDDDSEPGPVSFTGYDDDFTISLRGMSLVPVTSDMKSYFGEGSEHGLLIVESGRKLSGVHAGDVVLAVNGKSVRDGDRTSIRFDTSKDNTFDVLRKGKKMSITVRQSR